ncbi:MAG TPA: nuclear transport factor 2 family protein [Pseudonocardia sp.]|jgi:ketosteroid isomerase-like protein
MSDDAAAVLAVHNGWFKSNVGLDADAMLEFFPKSEGYLQFNLNGLTYNGAPEKEKLWRNLKAIGVNITRIEDTSEPLVQVFGDTALLTSEGVAELEMPSATGKLESPGPTRFRNTEFYRRTDGTGGSAGGGDWKIWHMHVSEAAGEGSLKYGTE